jgi:hypothetical protein
MSAGFGAAAAPFTIGLGLEGGTIASAIIGGTASALGGGRFANGAVTGAFGYLYNAKNLFNTKGSDSLNSRTGQLDQSGRVPNTTGNSVESYTVPDTVTDKMVNSMGVSSIKSPINHVLTVIGAGPIFTIGTSVFGRIGYGVSLSLYSTDLNVGEDKMVRTWYAK